MAFGRLSRPLLVDLFLGVRVCTNWLYRKVKKRGHTGFHGTSTHFLRILKVIFSLYLRGNDSLGCGPVGMAPTGNEKQAPHPRLLAFGARSEKDDGKQSRRPR